MKVTRTEIIMAKAIGAALTRLGEVETRQTGLTEREAEFLQAVIDCKYHLLTGIEAVYASIANIDLTNMTEEIIEI
jgi:hypothetical protein